jgi:hypothetical protein
MLLIVIEHIVWDWNGTLFDDAQVVYLAACEVFAAHGLPSVTMDAYRAAYSRPIETFYAKLFGRELAAGEFAGLDDDFHDAYRISISIRLGAGRRHDGRGAQLGNRTTLTKKWSIWRIAAMKPSRSTGLVTNAFACSW